MRHGAAMDCDDADEARDLLRHKNPNVTNAVYRRHFTTARRESLREKLEARHSGDSGLEQLPKDARPRISLAQAS